MLGRICIESIARMGETDKRMDSVSSEVVELIDDLATLYAIKYANEDSKNVVASLMDTESNSVAGLKPEGTIMTILRDMSQSDAVQDMAERLGLISQGIDRRRNFVEASVGRVIRNGFTRELSGQEAQALTEVLLDTDISSIYGKYDIQMMLRDQNEVTKAINDAKGKIREAVKNKEIYNY